MIEKIDSINLRNCRIWIQDDLSQNVSVIILISWLTKNNEYNNQFYTDWMRRFRGNVKPLILVIKFVDIKTVDCATFRKFCNETQTILQGQISATKSKPRVLQSFCTSLPYLILLQTASKSITLIFNHCSIKLLASIFPSQTQWWMCNR